MHPPWILYPGELPFSSQYSQGNGESCLLHVWLPFWLTCQPRRRRSIFATGMPRKNGRLIVGQRKNENSGGNPVVAHHVPRQNYSGACRRRLRYGAPSGVLGPRRRARLSPASPEEGGSPTALAPDRRASLWPASATRPVQSESAALCRQTNAGDRPDSRPGR